MGDAPLAFTETTGGVRVSENDVVSVGSNDVGSRISISSYRLLTVCLDFGLQGWPCLSHAADEDIYELMGCMLYPGTESSPRERHM